MRQVWQSLVKNHTFDVVPETKGNDVNKPMADMEAEEPIGCNWI